MSRVDAECVIVIPARYASTRLPGKPLLKESGKYLIQHVYEQASRVRSAREVLVATDDERIRRAVVSFGGKAVMTSADCRTGTDRVAEASRSTDAGIVVNLQGDEPEMRPEVVEAAVQALRGHPEAHLATPVARLEDPEDLTRSQVVKVVADARGRALYFSRAAIPHRREGADGSREPAPALRHVGLYAYRTDFLRAFVELPAGRLEQCENLEQLRALEAGYNIQTVLVDYRGFSIDTPEDYRRFVARSA